MLSRTMAKKNHLYRVAQNVYILSDIMPRRLSPAEASKLLRHAVAARLLGKKATEGLTPAERSARAKAAAAARWSKPRKAES